MPFEDLYEGAATRVGSGFTQNEVVRYDIQEPILLDPVKYLESEE